MSDGPFLPTTAASLLTFKAGRVYVDGRHIATEHIPPYGEPFRLEWA